jgi:hypothetical protein
LTPALDGGLAAVTSLLARRNASRSGQIMTVIEREFYRSFRGPGAADEDFWLLVFDHETKRLFVRHEWQTTRHTGVDEFEIAEFLTQESAAQAALIEILFDRVRSDA